MSFDHETYQRELIHRLTNGLGWTEAVSKKLACIASDVIRSTHGGERHYIQTRTSDLERDEIRSERAAGATIAALSRRFGLSAKTIRTIIN